VTCSVGGGQSSIYRLPILICESILSFFFYRKVVKWAGESLKTMYWERETFGSSIAHFWIYSTLGYSSRRPPNSSLSTLNCPAAAAAGRYKELVRINTKGLDSYRHQLLVLHRTGTSIVEQTQKLIPSYSNHEGDWAPPPACSHNIRQSRFYFLIHLFDIFLLFDVL
jgi:hypothetical protein